MAELLIAAADGRRERFALASEHATIGRSRDSDIFLPDQWLSRHHAEVRRSGNGWVCVDLGSKNGTLLNGASLADEHRLRDGDVITLGEHSITFVEGPAARADEEPEEAPAGTRVFSARELSVVADRPARDADELARQSRLLAVLSDAVKQLVVHRPLSELFDHVLNLLFQVVPAERGAILVLQGEPRILVLKASKSRSGEALTRVPRSISRLVLEGQSLLLPNVLEDSRFSAEDSILTSGIRSAMCVPLLLSGPNEDDSVIGVVYLDAHQRLHSFSEEDLRLLTPLANVAAAKIENVRLLEESVERRLLEEDMRVAAEIQQNLLPRGAPDVPGWDLVGMNVPCRTVGGDYYDFALQEGRLLVALGDVSGKGTGAALLMTVLRAAVRGLWNEVDIADAVARINHTIYQNTPTNKFVTFFLASVDPASGSFSYVNAGHNPPLLVRATGEVERLDKGGVVLGMMEGVDYEVGVGFLGFDDVLLIFSDGVTETWDPDDSEFGEEGVLASALAARCLSAAGIRDSLLEALEDFADGARATDDRTLVVLKRNRL